MTGDPLLQMIDRLPQAESDRVRADRVRARCHRTLGRRLIRTRRHVSVRRRLTRLWEPLIAGLGGVYLTETIRQALRVYGIL